MGTNLALTNVELDEMQRTAALLVSSGYFTASRDDRNTAIAQLATKIMAGRELGYGPYASVNGIHVIQGKPQVSANLMASAVKANLKYDYRVRKMGDTGVSIEFFEGGQSLGVSDFTADDAKRAGTQNMGKFPRNMMFARALSNGVRWFCPDVFNGQSVFVEGEIGEIGEMEMEPAYIVVDRVTGEVVEPVSPKAAEPAPSVASLADVGEMAWDVDDRDGITEEFVAIPSPAKGQTASAHTAQQSKQAAQSSKPADAFTTWANGIVEWALVTHRGDESLCSPAQYGYLVGVIDKIVDVDDAHDAVLSVLTGRPTSSENRVSKKLAGELLDYLLETKNVKNDDGTTSKVKNEKHRPTYVKFIKWVYENSPKEDSSPDPSDR